MQQRMSWFDRQLKKCAGNEMFIEGLASQTIVRDAPRIFKDLMSHSVNIEAYAKYFIDPNYGANKFMQCLTMCCQTKMRKYSFEYNACLKTLTDWPNEQAAEYAKVGRAFDLNDPAIQEQLSFMSMITDENKNLYFAYNTVLQELVNLANTKDPSFLVALGSKLQSYRQYLLNEGN